MSLTLLIENHQVLDDGGPAMVEVPATGLQAGRRAGMGWVLPDASRHISGHHFDVHHRDGAWWLHDVSTNGTFLQGARHRLDGPHRLEHGDRFQVGQYVVIALLESPPATGRISPNSLPSYEGPVFPQEPEDDPWALGTDAGLVPVDPLPPRDRAARADFAQDFLAFPRHAEEGMPPAISPAGSATGPAQMAAPLAAHASGTSGPADGADFIRAFCEGAGLSPDLAAGVGAGELGHALGQALRSATAEIMLALRDRAAAKQFVRVGERTMRAATDNNPLKFLPDPEQAIEAMFLRPRAGFQSGAEGFDEALRDLRAHQAALFAALQPALMHLLGDLAPEAIEAEAAGARFGANRKSRAWDLFVERWDARSAPHENGILDEFIARFALAYRDALFGGIAKRG